MRLYLWPTLLLAAGAWASGPAEDATATDVTLHYQARVAGALVGDATVTVALEDDRYRVVGDARSNGLLKGFSKWRNRFAAHGVLDDSGSRPVEFYYTERDRKKVRDVAVRDGTLQVTKNGKERPGGQAPEGSDVVSALFVAPRCRGDHVLHTGRYVYELERLENDGDRCRYRVTDDDDDSAEIELELTQVDGLVVPGKIIVYAWLTGSLELVEAQMTEPASSAQ